MADSEASAGTLGTVDEAASRNSRWDRVRPPIYRGLPYIRILLIFATMFLYRSVRTSGRAQEALFNDWLTYAIVVLGFYFVFGLAGQFAFSQAAIFGLGAGEKVLKERAEVLGALLEGHGGSRVQLSSKK